MRIGATLAILVLLCAGVWYLRTEQSSEQSASAQAAALETNLFKPVATGTIELVTKPIAHVSEHTHTSFDTAFDPGHHERATSSTFIATEDIWITGVEFAVINAPASTLHHGSLFNLSEESNTCGYTGIPQELFNLGEDTMFKPGGTIPEPYGIFIEKGQKLQLHGMFHNPKPPVGVGGDFHDVSFSATLDIELAARSERSRPVEFYILHLEDEPCTGENFSFAVPPMTTGYVKRPTGTAEYDPGIVQLDEPGELVYLGGHMHGWDGAQYIDVLKNGEAIRRFHTRRSEQPGILWETDHGIDRVAIEAGDVISLTATYDNHTSSTVYGAMGMAAFFFAPEVGE